VVYINTPLALIGRLRPMELLDFTQGLSDKDGNPIDPAVIGMPSDFPKKIHIAVVFKKMKCDMTELTITEFEWPVGQMYVYSSAGLHQSIDKLAEILKSRSL
jgi:hypothetical protein